MTGKVLTAVLLTIQVLCDVMLCLLVNSYTSISKDCSAFNFMVKQSKNCPCECQEDMVGKRGIVPLILNLSN